MVYRNSYGIDFRISHAGIQIEDAGEVALSPNLSPMFVILHFSPPSLISHPFKQSILTFPNFLTVIYSLVRIVVWLFLLAKGFRNKKSRIHPSMLVYFILFYFISFHLFLTYNSNFSLFMEEKRSFIGNPVRPSAVPLALSTIHACIIILTHHFQRDIGT